MNVGGDEQRPFGAVGSHKTTETAPKPGTPAPGGPPTPPAAASARVSYQPPPRESSTKHVGALLGGGAAFIAALTTAWVNLRDDVRPRKPEPAPVAVAAPAAARPVMPNDAPAHLRLNIERIAVDHDGSPGTTDWRFEVNVDGQRTLAFQQNGLDDSPGLNVAQTSAEANLKVPRTGGVDVEVKGWRLGPFHSTTQPDVTGHGKLTADGVIAPMPVQAKNVEEGAFVFTFHARKLEE